MKPIVVGFVALLSAACSGSPARPTISVDTRITVPIGQTVTIAATSASVRFESVLEDSRCPADANCVWQGQAAVRLTVVASARQVSIELRSDPAAARTASVNGLRFEWVQLDPYPFSSRPTQPGDYRLTIRVVR
ncbi:MAG: hypothetical protein IMZ67_04945, partial [Acidobacteria bacterium]|nr:hypothetical protein [Acidobacteriota bacterium]